MQEVCQGLLELYQVMRENITPEASQAAEERRAVLYSRPEILEALTAIISSPEFDSYFKRQAILSLRKVVQVYNQKKVEFDHASLCRAVVKAMVELGQWERNLLGDVVEALDDEAKKPVIFELATLAAGSEDPAVVEAALITLVGIDLDESAIHPLCFSLIDKGLKNSQTRTNAVNLGLVLAETMDDPENPLNAQVWNAMVQFTLDAVQAGDESTLKSMCEMIGNSASGVIGNAELALSRFLPLIGNPQVSAESQLVLVTAIEGILATKPGCKIFKKNPQMLVEMTNRFFELSAAVFNQEDELSVSLIDVFEQLSWSFCDFEPYVEYVFRSLGQLYEEPRTRAGVCMAISHMIDGSNDFIRDRLDIVVELAVRAASDPIRMVRDAATVIVREIAGELDDVVDDYFEVLGSALISSVEKEVTQDMLLALDGLFAAVSNTDPLFEPAYQYFVDKLINLKGAASIWYQYLFACIASLCKKSVTCVRKHFGTVFGMMFSVVNAKDNTSLLAESAIECIAHLSETCKELMAPKSLEFAQFLMSQLNTDDQQLQVTLLRSLGLIVQNEGQHLEPVAGGLLDALLEIGNRKVVEATELQSFIELLEQQGEAETEITEEEDDDETKVSPYAIPALALSVAAAITLSFPDLIQPRIEVILKGVQTQFASFNKDALDFSCNALTQFVKATAKLPDVSKELGGYFSSILLDLLAKTNDIDVAGDCFTAMGHVLHYYQLAAIGPEHLDRLLELMLNSLQGQLVCQNGSKGYIDGLHAPVCDTLREVICGLQGDAPAKLQPFIGILTKWCTSKNKEFRDFSMKVLGELVSSAPSIDAEFKQNVLQFAIGAFQRDSDAAAYVINQFTNAAPDLVRAQAEAILHICLQKLTQKAKRSVAYRALMDNTVALCGEIRRNVLGDEFPTGQFIQPCLRAMPAQYDEDANRDMFTFYVWLAEVTQVEPAELFAAAGVKLLCQPQEVINDVLQGGLGEKIVAIVRAALEKFGGAESKIEEWCSGDAFAVERLRAVLQM